ncbi:MAG: hypothetical protein LBU60_02925, partial [Clostridiales bacterium]|nr:hypothetical protein [Clostridiales bacterium]
FFSLFIFLWLLSSVSLWSICLFVLFVKIVQDTNFCLYLQIILHLYNQSLLTVLLFIPVFFGCFIHMPNRFNRVEFVNDDQSNGNNHSKKEKSKVVFAKPLF